MVMFDGHVQSMSYNKLRYDRDSYGNPGMYYGSELKIQNWGK